MKFCLMSPFSICLRTSVTTYVYYTIASALFQLTYQNTLALLLIVKLAAQAENAPKHTWKTCLKAFFPPAITQTTTKTKQTNKKYHN